LNRTSLAAVNDTAVVIVPAPPNVNSPFFDASPNVTEPPIEIAFANKRGVVPSLESTPPLIVTVPVPNAASFPTERFPAPTVVPPLYVLAPLSVSDPTPTFVNAYAPPTEPPKTTLLDVVKVVAAVNVPAPPNVNAPFFVASPSVTAPPIETPFAITRGVVPSLDTTAPPSVTTPAPNAPSFPT
jgi:hypothetical protein